jgi:outer membrane scaffolding protein for murein synthesis (MipA/OmpV family)
MQTFFGVDTTQSARSGLPLFEPDSGISAVRLFFSARYAVRPSWLLGGQLYASRSLGNAADSPITQRRTTPGAGVYVAYVLR